MSKLNGHLEREFIIDHLDTLEEAELCDHKTPDEEDFVGYVRARYERFGNGAYISLRQLEWLQQIAGRDFH